jgi:uncharacterized DUF497 family protein
VQPLQPEDTTPGRERAIVFRQNIAAEFEQIDWARSATKHRISRERIRYVLENSTTAFKEEPPPDRPRARDTRLLVLGEDAQGILLEVIAVESKDDSLTVIHAMKLRNRYRSRYEEVRRWRR